MAYRVYLYNLSLFLEIIPMYGFRVTKMLQNIVAVLCIGNVDETTKIAAAENIQGV